MKNKSLTTIRNKASHRLSQANKLTDLSISAMANGEIDKSVRLRNQAVRKRAWYIRYDRKAIELEIGLAILGGGF
jgi:hypothetical protein